jgi:hypothetical protein
MIKVFMVLCFLGLMFQVVEAKIVIRSPIVIVKKSVIN